MARHPLKLLSAHPLVVSVDGFLTLQECEALIALARHADPDRESSDVSPGKQVYSLSHYLNQARDEHLDEEVSPGVEALRKCSDFVEDSLGVPRDSSETDWPVIHRTPADAHRRLEAQEEGSDSDDVNLHRDGRMSLGLHLDTNHRPLRFATAIVYLRSLPWEVDGETVFPCADLAADSPARSEASCLAAVSGSSSKGSRASASGPGPGPGPDCLAPNLEAAPQPRFQHSDAALRSSSQREVDAARRLLTEHCPRRSAEGRHVEDPFSLQPIAGQLAIFFSRDRHGLPDPSSFHGGAHVLPLPSTSPSSLTSPTAGTEARSTKWTMQIFRAAPLSEALMAGTSKLEQARLRAAATGTGPLLWGAEAVARRVAQEARHALLTLLNLTEDDLDRIAEDEGLRLSRRLSRTPEEPFLSDDGAGEAKG